MPEILEVFTLNLFQSRGGTGTVVEGHGSQASTASAVGLADASERSQDTMSLELTTKPRLNPMLPAFSRK